jgi:hypothetical protein
VTGPPNPISSDSYTTLPVIIILGACVSYSGSVLDRSGQLTCTFAELFLISDGSFPTSAPCGKREEGQNEGIPGDHVLRIWGSVRVTFAVALAARKVLDIFGKGAVCSDNCHAITYIPCARIAW